MSWFFIALAGPFLWSIVNHLDKLLLEKYFKEKGVGALLIFSSLIGIAVLPFLIAIDSSILEVTLLNALLLLLVGVLAAFVLWLYFEALKDDEASIVVVFYQLIPVFGYIFGYYLLGESLTKVQLVAMALIIAGTTIISFEIDAENKFRLRRKTAFLMTLAAILSALDSVIFKYVAIEETLWVSLFWENLGLGVFGILIFAFMGSYRSDFIQMVKKYSADIFSLNILNEILYIIGNVFSAYAYLLAPIALVLLVNSYQPIIVFAIGAFLTVFFPMLGAESLKLRHITQKILALAIVGLGTHLLF